MGALRRDWFRVYDPRPRATARLVCFPHAGGAASSYRGWPAVLPPSVEVVAVQYPGRHDRHADAFPSDIPALADDIARIIGPGLDRPTAFFGHSMGGMVAFEVARRLRPRFPSPLARLFVSACRAPSACRPAGLTFENEELRAYVRDFGGSGAASLDNEDLWQLALPALRNDLGMTESYRYKPGPPLTCPVTVFAGDRDPSVTTADIQRWQEHTIAAFDTHIMPGGHFYLEDALPQLAALLVERISGLLDVVDTAHGG